MWAVFCPYLSWISFWRLCERCLLRNHPGLQALDPWCPSASVRRSRTGCRLTCGSSALTLSIVNPSYFTYVPRYTCCQCWSPKIGQIRFRGPVGGTGAAPATAHRAGRSRRAPGRPSGGLSAPTAAHRDTSKPPRVRALKLVPCPITGQTVLQQPCGLPGGFEWLRLVS